MNKRTLILLAVLALVLFAALVLAQGGSPPADVPAQIPVPVTVAGVSPLMITLLAIGSPLIMVLVQGWLQRRREHGQAAIRSDEKAEDAALRAQEKAADYARLDLVADRAEKLLQVQRDAAQAAKEAAAAQAAQLNEINEQGKKIHILVNSDMTAARAAERDAMRLLLVSLRLQVSLGARNSIIPSKSLSDEIERAEKRVEELNLILADRAEAQRRVDEEQARSKREADRAAVAGADLGAATPGAVALSDENRHRIDAQDETIRKLREDAGLPPVKEGE